MQIKRILLPTKFAEMSRAAAPYASSLAEQYGAEVHIFHAVSRLELVADAGIPGQPPIPGPPPQELLAEAQADLEKFVAEIFPAPKFPVRLAVAIGGPAPMLAEYASKHAIDMIVMGTHADGLLRRMVFGSVSKSLVEHSPCPVLLVPIVRKG